MKLSFDIDGEVQFARFLDLAATSVKDFSPIYEKIGQEFRETQEKVFESEGSFEGRQKWAPLSTSYEAWKTAVFPGRPILTLTGEMRASLTNKDHSAHVFDVRPDSLTIGTRDFKATLHHRGTTLMPQRKIIDLTDPQRMRWTKIMHTALWTMMTDIERKAMQAGMAVGRR